MCCVPHHPNLGDAYSYCVKGGERYDGWFSRVYVSLIKPH